MNRGRAFFTTPETLGDYVLVDFIEQKRAMLRGTGGRRSAWTRARAPSGEPATDYRVRPNPFARRAEWLRSNDHINVITPVVPDDHPTMSADGQQEVPTDEAHR